MRLALSEFLSRFFQPSARTETTEHAFEPAHRNMGLHLKSGILNSGAIQFVKLLCQFLSVIVLSRLLPPADFGIIAMVSPISGFVGMFQDLGLSQASIQKPALSHDEANAFFWINVAMGIMLSALIAAFSPLIGWYYHEPRVVTLSMAMGFLILISSIGNQPCAILMRRMNFGALSLINMLGAISGLAASIVLALLLKNYWALYFGVLIGTVLPVAGAWLASRWMPSFPRHVPGMRGMLKFGAGITGANIANFVSRNTDNVLIGHQWGDYTLGLYDRAYKLLLFPLQRIAGPVINATLPVFSRLNDEPERYRAIFLKIVRQLTLATWPGIIWAVLLDDTLVPVLLGHQWADASRIFEPLALAGFLQVVNGCASCLFISQGRSGEYARWSFFEAVTSIVAFLIGLPYGAFGVAVSYAVSEVLRTPSLWWYVSRSGPVRPMEIFRSILPQVIGTVASAGVLALYKNMASMPALILLANGLLLSYASFAAAMALLPSGRDALRSTVRSLYRLLEKQAEN